MKLRLSLPRLGVKHRPAVIVGLLGIGLAILLSPPVFDPLFALAPADESSSRVFFWISLTLGGLGAIVAATGLLLPTGAPAALYLSVLLVVGAELGFRGFARHLAGVDFVANHLARIPDDPDMAWNSEHADHPFLQYTGMPFSGAYNAWGFRGPTWTLDAAPGTLRVALLGGSTTEWGLGDTLPEALRPALRKPWTDVEVLNFGLAGWTTANSAVNVLLTVRDFSPDFVVVHHGWNDRDAWEGRCPRGDYASRFQTHPQMFKPVPDAKLLRLSALYRFARRKISGSTDGGCCGDLNASPFSRMNHLGPPVGQVCGEDIFTARGQLWAYERNLRSIVILSEATGSRAVIMTMPRTNDSSKENVERDDMAAMDAANDASRRVARETGALLLDLDAVLTGEEELFGDLAHMTPDGNHRKDVLLAQALAAWMAEGASPSK